MIAEQLQTKKTLQNKLTIAEDSGYHFVKTESKFRIASDRKKVQLTNNSGVPPSLFWICMSLFAIMAAFFFGIYAANNAQETIRSFIDPTNEGRISPRVVYMVGAAITIMGMILGEGLMENKPFIIEPTLERKVNKKFVIVLIGTIAYIGFQAAVTLLARPTDGDYSLVYVTVGIAVFEIILGMYVLPKALLSVDWIGTNLFIRFLNTRMDKYSRSANENYRYYLNVLGIYNQQYSQDIQQREGNENIRRAIAYYAGIQVPERGNLIPPFPRSEYPNQSNRTVERNNDVPIDTSNHIVSDENLNGVDRTLDELLSEKNRENDLTI
jgi:hypothetical protein